MICASLLVAVLLLSRYITRSRLNTCCVLISGAPRRMLITLHASMQDKDSLTADLEKLLPQLEELFRSNAELEERAAQLQNDSSAATVAASERSAMQQQLDERLRAVQQLEADMGSLQQSNAQLQQQLQDVQQVSKNQPFEFAREHNAMMRLRVLELHRLGRD